MDGERKKGSGGARIGAGRPKLITGEGKGKNLSLRVSESEIERLKELAKASGKTMSRYIIDKALCVD